MKMKYLLGTMLMAMAFGMTFSSCQKENDSTGIEFRIPNGGQIADAISLLRVDSVYYEENHHSSEYWWHYFEIGLNIN